MVSIEEYNKMKADYKANPTSRGAMQLNRYARKLKAQNQAQFGGTGEAFTFGDKTYQPGDEGYLEAINADKSIILKTANQQGGAQAVIDSISTRASYEDGAPETVVVPSPTSGGGGAETPTTTGSVPIVLTGGGHDPYQALYKGG